MCLSASWQLAAQIRNICATKWLAEYPIDTDAMAATAALLSFIVSPIIFPASSGAAPLCAPLCVSLAELSAFQYLTDAAQLQVRLDTVGQLLLPS